MTTWHFERKVRLLFDDNDDKNELAFYLGPVVQQPCLDQINVYHYYHQPMRNKKENLRHFSHKINLYLIIIYIFYNYFQDGDRNATHCRNLFPSKK